MSQNPTMIVDHFSRSVASLNIFSVPQGKPKNRSGKPWRLPARVFLIYRWWVFRQKLPSCISSNASRKMSTKAGFTGRLRCPWRSKDLRSGCRSGEWIHHMDSMWILWVKNMDYNGFYVDYNNLWIMMDSVWIIMIYGL